MLGKPIKSGKLWIHNFAVLMGIALKIINIIACKLLLISSMAASAACFTVIGQNNSVEYRSSVSPIDLSENISSGLKKIYPNGHLVFSLDGEDCSEWRADHDVVSKSGYYDAKTIKATPAAKTPVPEKLITPVFLNSEYSSIGDGGESSGYDYISRGGYSGRSGKYSSGGTVQVRSYYRSNGTFVGAHTRSAPGRGSGRR